MPLNFGGRKRSGAFDTVWPTARKKNLQFASAFYPFYDYSAACWLLFLAFFFFLQSWGGARSMPLSGGAPRRQCHAYGNSLAWAHPLEAFLKKRLPFEENFCGGALLKIKVSGGGASTVRLRREFPSRG